MNRWLLVKEGVTNKQKWRRIYLIENKQRYTEACEINVHAGQAKEQ